MKTLMDSVKFELFIIIRGFNTYMYNVNKNIYLPKYKGFERG